MKCTVTEEQLALLSSGDLDAAELLRLSSHVAECQGCREGLVDFERTSRILTSGFGEPDTHDLFAVRAAVRSGIESSHRSLGWRWMPAVAVLLLAVLSLPVLQHRKKVTNVTKATVASLPQPQYRVQLALPIPVRAAKRRRQPSIGAGLRHADLITTPQGKSQLMIATADPNVLILLPMDRNSHEN
jgi:anti-sigma factor RsiW